MLTSRIRISILFFCCLIVSLSARGDDSPARRALQEAHALRAHPEHRFEALTRALYAGEVFRAAGDAAGGAEAAFLAGQLLEDRDLAIWYVNEHPENRSGLDPALDYLTRADRLFRAAGDAVGGVKVAYELGNLEWSLGDRELACGFYRESLLRYDAMRAAQPGVTITILDPGRRDLRAVVTASLRRNCE